MSELVYFYAVTGGRCSGIFTSWNRVLDATVGYPGAKFNKFSTLLEAEKFMKEQKGNVKNKQTPVGWIGPAYAVAVGRRMGIFRTSQEALRQTLRYSANSLKRFNSYDKAVEFLDHHNWRQMLSSDVDSGVVDVNVNADEFSDAESNATKSEEENHQEIAHLEDSSKRERDNNADAEGQGPTQRLRTEKSAHIAKESIFAFCHGCLVRGDEDGEIVKMLCTFPVHPEWDIRKTLDGSNVAIIHAGLLAVLEALKHATREDPECDAYVAVFTVDRPLFDILRKCAHDGWQGESANRDLLQRITKEKRGRDLKMLHLDGALKWGIEPNQPADNDVALDV